jgi:hypothetical protein
MAFEIAHTHHSFGSLTPLRRALAVLLGLAFLAFLGWSCVTAYNARPLDEAPAKRPVITPGAGSRGA